MGAGHRAAVLCRDRREIIGPRYGNLGISRTGLRDHLLDLGSPLQRFRPNNRGVDIDDEFDRLIGYGANLAVVTDELREIGGCRRELCLGIDQLQTCIRKLYKRLQRV